MSVKIKNSTVILIWQVQDDTGHEVYQNQYEFTKDEYASLNWDELLVRQTADYENWLARLEQAGVQ